MALLSPEKALLCAKVHEEPAERNKAERALQNYQGQLEELVRNRKAGLATEIEVRRRAE